MVIGLRDVFHAAGRDDDGPLSRQREPEAALLRRRRGGARIRLPSALRPGAGHCRGDDARS